MTREGRFERLPDLPFSKLEEQVLVVVAKTREVHLLNESASRIWELLEAQTSFQGLMDALRDEYDLGEGSGEDEVESVLADMVAKGLVRPVPSGA